MANIFSDAETEAGLPGANFQPGSGDGVFGIDATSVQEAVDFNSFRG